MDTFLLDTLLAAYDTVVRYNTTKHELVFLRSFFPEISCNHRMTTSELHTRFSVMNHVHPDDVTLFQSHFNLSHLKHLSIKKESGLLFTYRANNDGIYGWASIFLFIPDNYSEENSEVLVCRKIINQNSSHLLDITAHYGKNTLKVVECNYSSNSTRLIKQRTSEDYVRRKHVKTDSLTEELTMEEQLTHVQDKEIFTRYTDGTFIEQYFQTSNTALSFFYRRKVANLYKWVGIEIIPTTNNTPNHRSYLFIMEDLDMVFSNLLEHFTKNHTREILQKENFLDNIYHILSYFTEKYLDFSLIDLKTDIYTMYKIRPESVNGNMPMVGNFTDAISLYLDNNVTKEQQKYLHPYTSSDKLRILLKDKSSLTFTYKDKSDRQIKTIITKVEVEQGIPTKIICASSLEHKEGLLKVTTFGNFDVYDKDGNRITFSKKQSKQLLAYLIDRHGFPVSTKDIAMDVLERDAEDLNAIKYVSKLSQMAIKDLKKAGYEDIIIKEWNSLRINVNKIDCDYYHLINGDFTYLHQYHNEYMKEYSWAEETNAEILHYSYI